MIFYQNFVRYSELTMIFQRNLILGLDLGTTSVKAVLLHVLKPENHQVVETSSQDTKANVCSDIGSLGSEQDVSTILIALQECVQRLDQEKLQRVSHIGVTGQLHGCMLWKERSFSRNNRGEIELALNHCSRLYTWQDSRCNKEFLASLPVPETHLRLATGHGCASLFWLQKHHPEFVKGFKYAGTVMDFLVSALCELNQPVMSVQTAASWGYFNTTCYEWNTERLSCAGFPIHLLPKVKHPGSIAGQMQTSWLGVPSGTRVGVALGDIQCFMLTLLREPSDAVVNIGTSAQLVTSKPTGFEPPPCDPDSTVEYFPYFGGQYLSVAAALNGGNAIASFISMLQEWQTNLGVIEISKDAMYERVLSAGIQVPDTDLVIQPVLLGERHQPDLKASVSNIMSDNLPLGHVVRALCRGVITNLHSMHPREKLLKANVSRIVGCGSALIRNKILQEELERIFGFQVVYNKGGDAAVGAALAMAN